MQNPQKHAGEVKQVVTVDALTGVVRVDDQIYDAYLVGEVSEHLAEALLGDLSRGADVHHQWHLRLFGSLRRGDRRAGNPKRSPAPSSHRGAVFRRRSGRFSALDSVLAKVTSN
jgi:hypothetical protein